MILTRASVYGGLLAPAFVLSGGWLWIWLECVAALAYLDGARAHLRWSNAQPISVERRVEMARPERRQITKIKVQPGSQGFNRLPRETQRMILREVDRRAGRSPRKVRRLRRLKFRQRRIHRWINVLPRDRYNGYGWRRHTLLLTPERCTKCGTQYRNMFERST